MLAFTSVVSAESSIRRLEEFPITAQPNPATKSGPAVSAADDPYLAMLRGAFWPTLAAGVICVATAWFLVGGPGLAGAVIAMVTVILFFGASLVIMSKTAKIAPINVMAVGVLTYVTKVGLLGLLFLLLKDAAWMDGQAFALTALICAAVWMPAEIWAFGKARLQVFDDPAADGDTPPEDGDTSSEQVEAEKARTSDA